MDKENGFTEARMLKSTFAAVAICIAAAISPLVAVGRLMSYTSPSFVMGGAANSSESVLTSTPQLAFPEMTLNDVKALLDDGYAFGACQCGTSCYQHSMHSRYELICRASGSDAIVKIVAVFVVCQSPDTKSIAVELTDGDGGVYARIGRTQRLANAHDADLLFAWLDGSGGVIYKCDIADSGVTDMGAPATYDGEGYGACGLSIVKIPPGGDSVLVWRNAAGASVLTVEDIRDYDFTAKFCGASVSRTLVGTLVQGYNKYVETNETGIATLIRVEFQFKESNTLKCALVEFTNGVDGVYATQTGSLSKSGVNYNYGHKFVRDDGTYDITKPPNSYYSVSGYYGIYGNPTGYAVYNLAVTPPEGVPIFTIVDGVLTAVELNGATSVVIPDRVKSIGDRSFYGCSGLTNITLSLNVTNIGVEAFAGCSGLTNVTIPNGVTSIGNRAFDYCRGLTNMTIPDSVKSIGSPAFTFCSHLTSLSIGNGVTNCWEICCDCDSLTEITVPQHMLDEGLRCFFRPDQLETITNITYSSVITNIGDIAFADCRGLTSVTIPDGVASIGMSAFEDCRSLTNVVIPDSVTNIGNYAFLGCSGLTSVTIGNGVTSIGDDAFQVWNYECVNSLTNFSVGAANVTYASVNGLLLTKDGGMLLQGINGDVTIPDTVTNIADYAFLWCNGLRSVTIPDSITNIGDTFSYCSCLTSVTIPQSVCNTRLSSVFSSSYHAITNVTITDGVTSIGPYVFSDCSELKSVMIPDTVTNIAYRSFASCSNLTSVTIPNSVTNIGAAAFYGCSSLTSITLPFVGAGRGNTDTSDALFGYIFGTSSYQGAIPTSQSGTIYYLPALLRNVVLTDEAVIGKSAFQNCSNLKNVTISEGVTNIGDNAFYRCDGLTSVTIPDSVTSIGWTVFYGCNGLESVIFDGDAPSLVNAYCFWPCTIYVDRNSAGWDVDIPGSWKGCDIDYIPGNAPPGITVTVNGGTSTTVTAQTNYSESVVQVNVMLGTTYPSDLEIPIKVTAMNNASLDVRDFIGLSESCMNGNTSWDTTLIVRGGSHTASVPLWMYANRGTVDTANGLLVEVDTARMDAVACAFFMGINGGATVFINPSTPVITSELPAMTTVANMDQQITINVADAYGELHAPSKYTVYWSNIGLDTPSSYTKIENLSATPAGDLTFLVKYTQAGECSSLYYVMNEDGVASAKHTVNVSVITPKVLRAVCAQNKFCEGLHDVVTLSFGEEGFWLPGGAQEGYVFFVPRSEAASNLVECAGMDRDSGDGCDWKFGYPIHVGDLDAGPIEVCLLDGDKTGTTFGYDVVVRTAQNWDEGETVSAWMSSGFNFVVTNAVPSVAAVRMGGISLNVNGGVMGSTPLVGTSKKFSAMTNEPSDFDLYADEMNNYADHGVAFTTKWTFDYGNGPEMTVLVFGPPLQEFDYTFTKVGACTITVRMRDKDMDVTRDEWGPAFTFTVNVGSGVTIQDGETVLDVPLYWIASQFGVSDSWLMDHPDTAKSLVTGTAANGRKVWECYALGLDPENTTNDFRIVSFPMKADGTPDLAGIVFDPPPSQWNVPATWKVKGAATLEGPWEDVPVGGGDLGEVALPLRFFKVEVVLP